MSTDPCPLTVVTYKIVLDANSCLRLHLPIHSGVTTTSSDVDIFLITLHLMVLIEAGEYRASSYSLYCYHYTYTPIVSVQLTAVEFVRNLMAHAQKPDFVFRLNGRVHLNRRGSQFSRLLAAEVCSSA